MTTNLAMLAQQIVTTEQVAEVSDLCVNVKDRLSDTQASV